MRESVKISVIVATYLRYDKLIACLNSLKRCQTEGFRAFEVIVVDDGGHLPKDIEEKVTGLDISWLYLPVNSGQPGAQAHGVEMAKGDILAFLDDDAEADENWLSAINQYFEEHDDIGAVLGRIEAADSTHVLQRMRQQIYDRRHRLYTSEAFAADLKSRYALKTSAQAGLSDHISGGSFAIRKSLLMSIGGFASDIRMGCDDAMSQKILKSGNAIGYDPGMIIYHHHNRSYKVLFHNNIHEGRDRIRLMQKGGEQRGGLCLAAFSSLFKAPFRIRKFPEMLRADKSRFKVYMIYTCVQLFDAMGQIRQAIFGENKPNDGKVET